MGATEESKALEVGAKLLAARDATRCWTEKDWKVTHWSTRSASVSFVVTADNATFFEASIETAYAPAMGVYHAMVAQYPRLKFRFRAHPFGDDGIYELNGRDGTFTETHIPFMSESLAEFGISWEEWQDHFTQPTDAYLEKSYSKTESTRTARMQRFPPRNWWRRLTRRQD